MSIWNIKSFGRNSYNNWISLDEADIDQSNLLTEILSFRENGKPKNDSEKKQEKINTLESLY